MTKAELEVKVKEQAETIAVLQRQLDRIQKNYKADIMAAQDRGFEEGKRRYSSSLDDVERLEEENERLRKQLEQIQATPAAEPVVELPQIEARHRGRPRTVTDQALIDQIREQRRRGNSIRAIAAEYSLPPAQIQRLTSDIRNKK